MGLDSLVEFQGPVANGVFMQGNVLGWEWQCLPVAFGVMRRVWKALGVHPLYPSFSDI